MGFFDGFTGKAQQRDIQAANAQATAALGQGRDRALAKYGEAGDSFSPYIDRGRKANALYDDAIGINGQPAYDAAAKGFAGSDPFRDANADYANNALMRQYGARGQSGGNAGLAVARAQTERGATDWDAYLKRLNGVGAEGFQATGARAGITTGQGDIESGYGQQMAGNAINYGTAMAGTRNILMQNVLGAAGTAAKFMAPSVNKLWG